MANDILHPPDRVNYATSAEYRRAYDRWRDKYDPRRAAHHLEKRRKRAELNKAYYAENRERLLDQKKGYYAENREAIRGKQKAYREENIESYRERDSRRYRENLAAMAQGGRARRSAPPWLTREQWKQMADIYELARRATEKTGILHVVDHIYPLKGRTSCGLHVPWNLRIVTNQENILKHYQIDKPVR
jgi:hypothetical protein